PSAVKPGPPGGWVWPSAWKLTGAVANGRQEISNGERMMIPACCAKPFSGVMNILPSVKEKRNQENTPSGRYAGSSLTILKVGIPPWRNRLNGPRNGKETFSRLD